ncbi:MAG: hypothetical protein ACRD8U_10785 [Pyrinomonadaceae bacterium]
MKKYPDVSQLLALKEWRRRKLARLPITEKMEIAERLREIARHAPGRSTNGHKAGATPLKISKPKKKRYG